MQLSTMQSDPITQHAFFSKCRCAWDSACDFYDASNVWLQYQFVFMSVREKTCIIMYSMSFYECFKILMSASNVWKPDNEYLTVLLL